MRSAKSKLNVRATGFSDALFNWTSAFGLLKFRTYQSNEDTAVSRTARIRYVQQRKAPIRGPCFLSKEHRLQRRVCATSAALLSCRTNVALPDGCAHRLWAPALIPVVVPTYLADFICRTSFWNRSARSTIAFAEHRGRLGCAMRLRLLQQRGNRGPR